MSLNNAAGTGAEYEPTSTRWYVIQCKPREDERVVEHLTRQHFQSFYARRRVERRYPSGRRYFSTEAFFPGYIFVKLDRVQDNWSTIRSTRRVNRIVRFSDEATPVSEGVVERIRDRLESDAPEPYLKPGECVRIIEGAFSNLEALFLARDSNERVVLLLNLMQSEQALSFPARAIRKFA